MQSVLSRIWTRVAVSISYNDNHYTTSTSNAKSILLEEQVGYCFAHTWEDKGIYTFLKGISAMWNAIVLAQDLNSCCRVHLSYAN